jgi:hypothetical protein
VSTFAGIPKEKGSRTGPKEQALFDLPDKLTFSKCGKFRIVSNINNIKDMKIKN